MCELKYQSSEWVQIQQEMHEDENAKSILEDFNQMITKYSNKRTRAKNFSFKR